VPRFASIALALTVTAAPLARAGDSRIPPAPERIASAKAYAHYLRAKQAELQGDWRRSLDELQSAVAFDSGSATLRIALAEAYARAGLLGRAEVEARRAIECDPAGPAGAEAHFFLG